MSSMPMEIRTRSRGTSSWEPVAEEWVMVAGCSTSDSTPPSDSARQISLVLRQNTRAASSEWKRTEIMPPKRFIWRLATSWPGCEGRPG